MSTFATLGDYNVNNPYKDPTPSYIFVRQFGQPGYEMKNWSCGGSSGSGLLTINQAYGDYCDKSWEEICKESASSYGFIGHAKPTGSPPSKENYGCSSCRGGGCKKKPGDF